MEGVKLPQKERLLLENFVGRLRKIYGDILVSAILYGSAASGEFTEKHSNINLLVVLKTTDLNTLSKAYNLVSSSRFRSICPVFFTEDYIRTSTDVFPIEFLDMKENYTVLNGKDVLKDLKVDTRNLRFQCEQELKSKLITVKRQYLAAHSRKEFEDLLFKTFTSCLHIMRNILRIKGKEPPYLKVRILSEIEKELSVDTTVQSEILWAKTKKMQLTHSDVDALLVGFVKELEAIVRIIDKL
jgi:hypothetical protein